MLVPGSTGTHTIYNGKWLVSAAVAKFWLCQHNLVLCICIWQFKLLPFSSFALAAAAVVVGTQ